MMGPQHKKANRSARASFAVLMLGLFGIAACGGGGSEPLPASPPTGGGQPVQPSRVPLNDLGTGQYLGFAGGLYPGGSNSVPAVHHNAGIARALSVQPLDVNGMASPSGKVVLLSIGMSNTTQEFCSGNSDLPCSAGSFMGQAANDAAVNKTTLVIVNGAQGGRSAAFWDSPADVDYDRVRDTRLVPQGLTEQQVQVAWVKVANPGPTISLPSSQSDAFLLVTQMGNIVRALRTRYPNLKLVFLSSRIYAGYATTTLNPEPYAYESGFSVKWVVQAQMDQIQNSGNIVDTRAGDLNYKTGAPWIAWGPYLWANGTTPRSDGLIWVQTDLANDGTHPSQSGEQKVGTQLLNFFKTSPYTKCWFLAGGSCP